MLARSLVILALACPAAAAAQSAGLWTADEKAIYAMGVLQSRTLEGLLFTEQELEIYRQGLVDGFGGALKLPLDEQLGNVRQFQRARAEAAAAAEQEAADAFLERAAAEQGAERTSSGLVYTELVEGTGRPPAREDTVSVHYHGTLRDGTVFDSSVDRGAPATFPLGRVIACWTEGVQRMRVGGKAKLVCPPSTAYGERGFPPLIRPNAALVFEVELLGIQ